MTSCFFLPEQVLAAIGNLEREDYAVLRAYSGTEAQMLLKNVRPNLLRLDLMCCRS